MAKLSKRLEISTSATPIGITSDVSGPARLNSRLTSGPLIAVDCKTEGSLIANGSTETHDGRSWTDMFRGALPCGGAGGVRR